MKTITEKYCKWHGQYVYPDNRMEHQMASCEVIKVQTEIFEEHIHRFELIDCARPMVCVCGAEKAGL